MNVRTRAFAVIAAAALSLGMAGTGTAQAQPKPPAPVKKGCSYEGYDYWGHGDERTKRVKSKTYGWGTAHYVCNNGKWEWSLTVYDD